MKTIPLPNDAATAQLGANLAVILQPGDAICLWGPLGAGKSTLARGLVRALTTPDEDVPSPTFTLVQTYDGPSFTIAHFDLYRLNEAAEAFELGLDEALDDGIALIEWPERLSGRLPPCRLDIEIEVAGDGRIARLKPQGTFEDRTLEF